MQSQTLYQLCTLVGATQLPSVYLQHVRPIRANVDEFFISRSVADLTCVTVCECVDRMRCGLYVSKILLSTY